jgi:hypothetical protein
LGKRFDLRVQVFAAAGQLDTADGDGDLRGHSSSPSGSAISAPAILASK